MSRNMIVLTAILALGALLSARFLFATFTHTDAFADKNPQTASLAGKYSPKSDQDQDGLPDSEETYWKTDFTNADTDGDGFKDGEEVASGHNPAKKGPDDLINNAKNISERLTRLTAGGILAGDLNPTSPKYDASVQRLTDDIAEKYRQNNTVVVDQVLLTPSDDPADRQAYVVQMAWAIQSIFVPALDDAEAFLSTVEDLTWGDPSPLTGNPQRYATFTTQARKLAQVTGQRAGKIAAARVPFAFSLYHKNAIKLLRTMQRQYELVATMKEDPLQGLGALQSLITLHTEAMPAFMADYVGSVSRKLTTNEAQ